MKLLYSEKCLAYREEGYVEGPERLRALIAHLRLHGMTVFAEPPSCVEEDLLLVHTPELVRRVKENDFFLPDTPNLPHIYSYARAACGGACAAMESALGGEPAFSLFRPPGHHAGRNYFGGFCFFNGIALAVKKALLLGRRVAVLDLDGHHGNGTEDILRGEESALFVSVHQHPAYPGTGVSSFGNCVNLTLPPGSDVVTYLKVLDEAARAVDDFRPDVLAVSMGFDAHRDDPLLELNLHEHDYAAIGRVVAARRKPFFIVLEGGYNTRVIGSSCFFFLRGLEGRRGNKQKGSS